MTYSAKEVKGILDNYVEFATKRHRPYIAVRLADLQRAMHQIPYPLREAAFLLGVAQMPLREAAELSNVSHTRIGDRYRYAIDELLIRLNGG